LDISSARKVHRPNQMEGSATETIGAIFLLRSIHPMGGPRTRGRSTANPTRMTARAPAVVTMTHYRNWRRIHAHQSHAPWRRVPHFLIGEKAAPRALDWESPLRESA
jgi:hypothetical protein